MSVDEMYYELMEEWGVSEETLNVVVSINGYNKKTMEDILYVVSGYRNFNQY